MKKMRETGNRKKDKKTRRIGYLRYTGTLAFTPENKPGVNPLHNLIRSLAENQRYKGRMDGYHSFTWGQLAPLNEAPLEGRTNLSLEFKSARPRFMDLLVEAALRQAEECTLSFSLRGESIDFKALREMAGSEAGDGAGDGAGAGAEAGEERMENFNVVLPLDGASVRIAAYPKASMCSVVAALNRESLKPSEVIRIIIERVFKG
ncbi:MAG: hypothetical protein QW569_01740 [Candidatus Bathyarchaeia archaeon]|nr:hypothetical protein [Candidatus Bathyarchaeota archaeon]